VAHPADETAIIRADTANITEFKTATAALKHNALTYRTLSGNSGEGGFLPEYLKDAKDLVEIAGLAIDIVEALNKWVSGHPPQSNPLLDKLADIDRKLREIEDIALGSWTSQREANLQEIRAHSTTALLTVKSFIESGSHLSAPGWAERVALAERDSIYACQVLVQDVNAGFWRRPLSIKAISIPSRGVYGDPESYSYGWMPYIPDRAEVELSTVWDYRWALPVAVYAISCRVLVMTKVKRFTDDEYNELRGYLDILAAVCRKMDAGIREIRVPTEAEAAARWASSNGVQVAAADIYGGLFYSRGFFRFRENEFFGAPGTEGLVYPDCYPNTAKACANVAAISQMWRNAISYEMGWPELLEFWGALDNMRSLDPDTSGLRKGPSFPIWP
jgi:hypothetical protein